ncbi:MAG: hypothetical protein EOP48_13690 [Sphingobacteriales bacterium]|nr:MAG: hypothetical protein EOP48_13690 [Sphingobacteriales bacterium]
MKSSTAYVLGAIAGAAVGAAFLYRNRERIDTEKMKDTVEDWVKSAKRLGIKVKNTLLHDVSGPDGEPVFQDMYYRQFYENKMGNRVYIEEA